VTDGALAAPFYFCGAIRNAHAFPTVLLKPARRDVGCPDIGG